MNFNSTENMEIKCIQFELNFLVNKIFLPASPRFDDVIMHVLPYATVELSSIQFTALPHIELKNEKNVRFNNNCEFVKVDLCFCCYYYYYCLLLLLVNSSIRLFSLMLLLLSSLLLFCC